MASVAEAVKDLSKFFGGELLLPSSPSYDDTRRLHNGLIDRRPALVARCRGVADIVEAVGLARTHGLEISVRGGGHNVAGRASVDAGVMIDLSLMRGTLVDPAKKLAWTGGGATWKDFNRETQQFALATTGGVVSSTGVAGLTLGGGFGWLMPRFGMALDNLRAVRLILADGSTVWADKDQNPDLFWAVRGGGGNFGIAALFGFDLHEVGPMVTGGLVAHPGDRARDVMQFFRDKTTKLPDEVFMVCALLSAPDGSGHKIVGLAGQHSGSLAAGEAFFKPIKAFGPPIMDMLGPMPYVASNMMLDDAFQKGSRNYWKSHFATELSDGLIDALIAAFQQIPTPMCQLLLENFHGAVTRVPIGDTAFTLRDTGYNVLIVSQWVDPKDDERCIKWARDTYASLKPFVGARRYVNYLNEEELGQSDNLTAVYGPNLPRLRKIKKHYDPENVFHLNLNIPPA